MTLLNQELAQGQARVDSALGRLRTRAILLLTKAPRTNLSQEDVSESDLDELIESIGTLNSPRRLSWIAENAREPPLQKPLLDFRAFWQNLRALPRPLRERVALAAAAKVSALEGRALK